eukprot:TRINITY_DN2612_c0_g1_i1.p1 TRINITY_DN2612_c0_g1~~TRINITY_DN2612_c0_g1_i1.p1  ORF type:complete len:331 (+),score=20.64 TRINITY_DN2612_c0_g1_i1:62-1054(+)
MRMSSTLETSSDSTALKIDLALGFFLYVILFISAVISFVKYIFTNAIEKECKFCSPTVEKIFHWFLIVFAYVRAVWFVGLFLEDDDNVFFIINRLALVLFITTITSILFWWANRYHSKNLGSKQEYNNTIFYTFIITNISFYTFEILLLVIVLLTDDEYDNRTDNPFYSTDIISTSLVYCLIAFAFIFYGFFLFIKESSGGIKDRNRFRSVAKIVLTSCILSLCFLCRIVALSYRPIFDSYLPDLLYYSLSYFIPEIIPSFLMIFFIHNITQENIENRNFINAIYAEEEENKDNKTKKFSFESPYDDFDSSKEELPFVDISLYSDSDTDY